MWNNYTNVFITAVMCGVIFIMNIYILHGGYTVYYIVPKM